MKIPGSLGRVAVAAGAVLVLGGSAVGIAAAQSQPASPTSTPYQKFIDALAQRLNVTPQQLQTDITQARQDAGLPANGQFPGGGRRGPGGPGPAGFGFGARMDLQTAANTLGITPQQLRTELQGKSLAQVAEAHGKMGDDIATALKNAAHTQIDTQIDQLVNRVVPQNANLSGPNGNANAQTGNGQNGNGPRGRRGFGPGPGMFQQGLNTAAQAIGISADQLRSELPGKSLAQVAQAHNHTAADVSNALKNAAHTQIDSRIDQLVNQVMPQRGPRNNNNPSGGSTGDDTEQSQS